MKRFFLVLLMAAVGAYALRGVLLPPVARFLNVSSDCELPVEYAVPPPGDNNTRTLAAAALVRNSYAEKVAIVQNPPSPREIDGIVPPSAAVTRDVLQARGIKESRIVSLTGESASTLDDMRLLSQLWEKSPDARVAIVSNGYHLRRLRWSLRRALPDRASQVSYVAAPIDEFDETKWWRSEQGLSSVMSEYAKLAFYVLKYGSARQRILLTVPLLGILAVVTGWIVRRRALGGRSAALRDSPTPPVFDNDHC